MEPNAEDIQKKISEIVNKRFTNPELPHDEIAAALLEIVMWYVRQIGYLYR